MKIYAWTGVISCVPRWGTTWALNLSGSIGASKSIASISGSLSGTSTHRAHQWLDHMWCLSHHICAPPTTCGRTDGSGRQGTGVLAHVSLISEVDPAVEILSPDCLWSGLLRQHR